MYNDSIKKGITDNLENKIMNIANISVILASQGYLVNRNKSIKLDWSSIVLHAFDNIDVFNEEQQTKLETIYNKLSNL